MFESWKFCEFRSNYFVYFSVDKFQARLKIAQDVVDVEKSFYISS